MIEDSNAGAPCWIIDGEVFVVRSRRVSPTQLEALRAARERKSAAAAARDEANTIVIPDGECNRGIIDPRSLPARKKLGRPPGIRDLAKEAMPPCPQCGSSQRVVRAGFANGRQRFKCKGAECRNRTFGGYAIKICKRRPKQLMCYRCGSEAVRSIGMSCNSGWEAHCRTCNRRFTQGGRSELARYHLLLERRLKGHITQPELLERARQMAYAAIINGEGYCWNLDLLPIVKVASLGGSGGDDTSDALMDREISNARHTVEIGGHV